MKIKAKEINKTNVSCGIGACPSVFKTNRGTVIVVGSVPANADLPLSVRKKMGKGEMAIELPAEILIGKKYESKKHHP